MCEVRKRRRRRTTKRRRKKKRKVNTCVAKKSIGIAKQSGFILRVHLHEALWSKMKKKT